MNDSLSTVASPFYPLPPVPPKCVVTPRISAPCVVPSVPDLDAQIQSVMVQRLEPLLGDLIAYGGISALATALETVLLGHANPDGGGELLVNVEILDKQTKERL